ncbi:MAG: transglutaminase domain-containing protein [Prolixibacteraceae bacterium]|nr:transglutaminase domain-containing protein [Prolixibacteraceae bacterium]
MNYQQDLICRIRKEFSVSENEVRDRLKKYYPQLTGSMMRTWERTGELEMRVIDGQKQYFNRAVGNFFLLNKEAKILKDSVDGEKNGAVDIFKQRYLSLLFSKNEIISGLPFDCKKIRVEYSVRLKANVIPSGEIVRCWLPYPRIHLQRQTSVEFLNAGGDRYVIAPEKQLQRTIYIEKPAYKDSVTEFRASYILHTASQWFNIDPANIKPYDTSSRLFQEYTAEQLPHIVFSDQIKQLSRKIVGNETNPFWQVRSLYYWIDSHIPWAGALEYSVMECIPEYVLKHRHGDCGMQTFLFLSMARSLGIPCKWQSGWYLLPEEKNLHDWAEVYYEGIGWVPVDVSFRLTDSADRRVREFYLNGMDSYRLIINDGYAQKLFPAKKYPRSEPYDFQRGELEWNGGNLYFDKWSYHMKVSVEPM